LIETKVGSSKTLRFKLNDQYQLLKECEAKEVKKLEPVRKKKGGNKKRVKQVPQTM
jgi:hypothetical protein